MRRSNAGREERERMGEGEEGRNRSMGERKEGRKEVSAQAILGLAVNYMGLHPYAVDFIALTKH